MYKVLDRLQEACYRRDDRAMRSKFRYLSKFTVASRGFHRSVRSNFFTERVINLWNNLLIDRVDFSSLPCFKRSIRLIHLLLSFINSFLPYFCCCVSYIVCFVNYLVFNTRVNVYFQGNCKCSFLPGCACLYLYNCIDVLCSLALKLNDDDEMNSNAVRLNNSINHGKLTMLNISIYCL